MKATTLRTIAGMWLLLFMLLGLIALFSPGTGTKEFYGLVCVAVIMFELNWIQYNMRRQDGRYMFLFDVYDKDNNKVDSGKSTVYFANRDEGLSIEDLSDIEERLAHEHKNIGSKVLITSVTKLG